MKLVLFSDLHLDSAFAWLGGNRGAGERRRRALRETLERIARLAQDEKADALLCGGDLYEQERFTPDTAAFLRATFEQVSPLPVYLAPGNHDCYGTASLYARVPWTPNVHVFRAGHLEPVTLADGLTLWGAAHQVPANTPNFLDGFRVDRSGVHLALFHGSERSWLSGQGEGKEPHAPFDVEDIPAAGLHFALLGHYHRPRRSQYHVYPGNPDPLSFGEVGERGAVVATVQPTGQVDVEVRLVAQTVVHAVPVDVTGCLSGHEARERVRQRIAGLRGYARISLEGQIAPDANMSGEQFSEIPTTLDGYQLDTTRLQVGFDFDRIAREPSIAGRFVQLVQADTSLSAEERRLVLVTGMRALNGRDDLEAL